VLGKSAVPRGSDDTLFRLSDGACAMGLDSVITDFLGDEKVYMALAHGSSRGPFLRGFCRILHSSSICSRTGAQILVRIRANDSSL
jgi:hypothetical protein